MIDRLRQIESTYDAVVAEMATPEAAGDPARLQVLGRELSRLEPVMEAIRAWSAVRDELEATRSMAHDPDEEVRAMAREELAALEAREQVIDQDLRRLLVPRDPNDDRDVILEVRAGTGGDEAALFAGDLYRMYNRYAERRRWKFDLISVSEGAGGGVKEAIAEIAGQGAYSRLKFESGVHRVQRVPATEAAGRIHTSTATVSILPEADEVEIQIPDKDLRIDVYRSSGPGGQSVNTTDSAVRITHLPTGTVVSCQNQKSQLQNKESAMRVLRARLYQLAQDEADEVASAQRRSQIRTVDRSERIRTYNFPENRIADHRTGYKAYNLAMVLDGDLDPIVQSAVDTDDAARMATVADGSSGL